MAEGKKTTRKVPHVGKVGCAKCYRMFTLSPRHLERTKIECPCGNRLDLSEIGDGKLMVIWRDGECHEDYKQDLDIAINSNCNQLQALKKTNNPKEVKRVLEFTIENLQNMMRTVHND